MGGARQGATVSGAAQDELTARQFGAQAQAYVASPDHASGADLPAISRIVGRRGGRVLDIGSGGGHASFAAAETASFVVSCDLSAAMLAALRGEARARSIDNIAPVRATAAALPFTDGSFDCVVTRYSAHHWSDLGVGLREMRRVLVPGGQAIIIDVVAPETPTKADTFLQTIEIVRDPSHVRDYSAAEWRAALEGAGFAVATITPFHLDMDMEGWLTRIGAGPAQASAIRAIAERMPAAIRDLFFTAPGRLRLPTVQIEATA